MRVVVSVAIRLCVDAVIAMGAVGAVAMGMTADWSGVVCVVEDVVRKGSRDWRESVARALTEVALEGRLHGCSYGRLGTGE